MAIIRKRVKCYVTRHGEPLKHDGKSVDRLSDKGVRQAVAAARTHFGHEKIDAAYCSEMERTWQTVQRGLDGVRQPGVAIIANEAFGYAWLDGPEVPEHDYFATLTRLNEENGGDQRKTTIFRWMEVYAPAWGMRARVLGAMLNASQHVVARNPGKDEDYVIVVGSHGPTGACAAVDPRIMPSPGYADTVLYTVDVEWDDSLHMVTSCKLISSEFLPCPPCD